MSLLRRLRVIGSGKCAVIVRLTLDYESAWSLTLVTLMTLVASLAYTTKVLIAASPESSVSADVCQQRCMHTVTGNVTVREKVGSSCYA
jgi:hypothetical protein